MLVAIGTTSWKHVYDCLLLGLLIQGKENYETLDKITAITTVRDHLFDGIRNCMLVSRVHRTPSAVSMRNLNYLQLKPCK